MTHAIIIRFHYEKGDPRYEARLGLLKELCMPSLENQTDKNFKVYIRVNAWQVDELKALFPKINIIMVHNEQALYKGKSKRFFYDFVPWKSVMGLPMVDIQTGIDSDDFVGPHFIETIHDYVKENGSEKSLHLSFQPEIYDLKTETTKPMKSVYSSRKGSAFMSLYQPKKKGYHFIYERSHLELGRVADKSVCVPAGQAFVTVHENNESTTQ